MIRTRQIIGIGAALLATAVLSPPCAANEPTAPRTSRPSAAAQDAAIQPTAVQTTAVHALRWAFYFPNGYRWEYSGIVVRHDGELGYSFFPRTLKKVDAVEMNPTKQRAPGDTLVALYHTHPCKPQQYFPQYFSPQDLISAFFWHVPTFILDECTGDVHEFDPAVDRVRDTGVVVVIRQKDGRPRRVRLPAGRIVGNIGDRGPDLSLIEKLMHRTIY